MVHWHTIRHNLSKAARKCQIMLKIVAGICVTGLLSLCAMPSIEAGQLSTTMHEMAEIMIRLVPWTYKEQDARPATVEDDINRLASLFAQSAVHFENRSAGVKLSHKLLNQQLQNLATNAINYGDNSTRLMLGDTFPQCMSCHNQDQIQRQAFSEGQLAELDDGFAKAELLFMTRDYSRSLNQYITYLKRPIYESVRHNRAISLERILVLAIQMHSNLNDASNIINQAAKLTQTSHESGLIQDWLTSLSEIANGYMSPINFNQPDIKDFSEFMEKSWPDIKSHTNWQRQQVYWVVFRRYLHQYISAHQHSVDMPKLLYWLALSDRSLQFKFYDGLSRLYLLECITKYPDHPFAKQCFDEYELLMIVAFSGSAGTTIPEDVQQDIDVLRKLVYPN
jgi:hypothetical protein